MNTENPMVIEYGTQSFDFSTLPAKSVRAMLSRGVTHYLGSEQASKVGPKSSWAEKFEKDNGRKPTDDEVAAQKALNLAKAAQALIDGTIGAARGPKADPIEAAMEAQAEREVWDVLAGAKLCKANRKPKDEDSFEFENGDKFTFAELIERRLANPTHEARIRAAAVKKVEAERKARDAARAKAEAAGSSGPKTTDNLGL